MTKFKVYRVSPYGQVQVDIVEAYDWTTLISSHQHSGFPIFKIEVYSGPEPVGAGQRFYIAEQRKE